MYTDHSRGDNDPKHSQGNSQLVSERDNNAAKMSSVPGQSTDLNPTENLWKELKVSVHRWDHRSFGILKNGPKSHLHVTSVSIQQVS